LPEAKEPVDPENVKEIASGFLSTLGLLDLILGGLALYWVSLWIGAGTAKLFPSTNLPIVDTVLLASAAALVGKVIILMVNSIMAVVDSCLLKHSTYYKELTSALELYWLNRGDPQHKVDRSLERAMNCLENDAPLQAQAVERIGTAAVFAYGAFILAILYALYLYSQSIGIVWVVILSICVVVFFVLGFFEQIDQIVQATIRLEHLAVQKREKE
jgi:hypothetical protein